MNLSFVLHSILCICFMFHHHLVGTFLDKATQNKLQCIFPLIVFILNFQIVSRTAIIIFV